MVNSKEARVYFSHPHRHSGTPHPDNLQHGLNTLKKLERRERIGDDNNQYLYKPLGYTKCSSYATGKFQMVPYYAETVFGKNHGYDPERDCRGMFTTSKFKPNNNCYNYACDVATNSFAQPGRKNGILLNEDGYTIENVLKGAQSDGLVLIPDRNLEADQLGHHLPKPFHKDQGHFVALLWSKPDQKLSWKGNFHWVRCDDFRNQKWSQKDGDEIVTNFDFVGKCITNPKTSNWIVNEGKSAMSKSEEELRVKYDFHAWMFVPYNDDGTSKVDIL